MATYSQQEARKQCIHAFATSAIFDRRARVFKTRQRLVNGLGVLVPVAVGGVVLAGFKLEDNVLKGLGALLAIQLVLSVWALLAGWDSAIEQASESRANNRELGQQYQSFIFNPPAPGEWDVIEAQRNNQERDDEKEGVKQSELRYGMRYALKQEQFPCATCGQTPTSMSPTKCDTCGNFMNAWKR